ncbi:MAG: hypothetical protein ACR2MX_10105 [Cyclobacteriaceae bacterium]
MKENTKKETSGYIRIKSGNRSMFSILRDKRTEERIVTVGRMLERMRYMLDHKHSQI